MIWLLDTNTIIYAQYVGGRVRERLDEVSQRGRVVTSVLVIAELFYGAAKSARPEANRRKVEQIVRAVEVLPITVGSAARLEHSSKASAPAVASRQTSTFTSPPLRSKRVPRSSLTTVHCWPATSKV